jgi:hypothetical protein
MNQAVANHDFQGRNNRAGFFKLMRRLVLVLILLANAGLAGAGETNYFCIVCGKGPLTGKIYLHPRGPICGDCYKLENRCSLCGLPVRTGDGSVKTGDGRFICKIDKPDAVLDVDAARDLFENVRQDVVDLYGRKFMLKYPDVTVNMFDVDYWSEKGRDNGLDKYGFASTRRMPSGACTHEVVMLSGELRDRMVATAAHEYTHLWIFENCPTNHEIDGDTVEAICELTAYQLMQKRNLPDMQRKILENPYTHGEVSNLVAIAKRYDTDYVLDWVKNGRAATFEEDLGVSAHVAPSASASFSYVPRPLPEGLKFSGLLTIGRERQAVINGVAFATGDRKQIKLRDKTVLVLCREIQDASVVLELDGSPERMTLKKGGEKLLP